MRRAKTIRRLGIGELRRQLDILQAEIGDRLGVTQPCIAKIEHQDDMRLSTLRRYIASLDGELRLIARIEGTDYELVIGSDAPVQAETISTQNNRGLPCNLPNTLSHRA